MTKIMIQENQSLDKSNILENTFCLYNYFNNYSVVAYNSNFNVDVFNQVIPSLENKKVLNIYEYSTKIWQSKLW